MGKGLNVLVFTNMTSFKREKLKYKRKIIERTSL